ncbi:MAG: tRNA 5-methoxyuridine(34)/uridine 5-oxyacetic acid(34) synthase CmoB [SAR324 cluster bacterium]|nr:tRNA 5-methoxyuridine(34)/uridine 5-oxyacetic acid(34) synthase CmoB [SAR324 cluster bacterium]
MNSFLAPLKNPDEDYLHPWISTLAYEQIQQVRKERIPWLKRKSSELFSEALESLPSLQTQHFSMNQDVVTIGHSAELSAYEKDVVIQALKTMMPWRKGPFEIFGTYIDSEWQSYRKWNRVLPHIGDLKDKIIADIGCNNGYYMFRMLEHQPRLVIGMDPNARYWFMFHLLQHFARQDTLRFELLGIEHMGLFPEFFDVVFCMGILYHHPDPIGMLQRILSSLKPGGLLIVESQGIPGTETIALFPENRYAKVPGTWFVPTASCLKNWIHRAGFRHVELFDQHDMTAEEQRKTEWAPYESLEDFLDPENPLQTVEGYPAPLRFYVKAIKPMRP